MGQQRIFARYPIPSRVSLKTGMENWAKENGTSLKDELAFYIRCRIGDIKESTEIILREEQRIKKAKKCMRIAISLMSEKSSKQVKKTIKRFYKDLSAYSLNESKSKLIL